MKTLRFFALILSILCCNIAVWAAPLQFSQVLHSHFLGTAALNSLTLQVDMRQLDADQAEALLDARFNASLGWSDELAPTTSPFAATGSSLGFASGQWVQPLVNGSTLTAKLNYNRAELSYPSSVSPAFQSSINPIYQHQIDLIYRYPLWQGAGNAGYTSQKGAAKHEKTAAIWRISMLKEQLASQGLALYFQYVLHDLSLSLADDAMVRAKKLLSYQRKREQLGLIEKADRLQADALLATRSLQHVQALGAVQRGQTALNRFMFQAEDNAFELALTPIGFALEDVESAFVQAQKQRPVFAMLQAQYAAAETRLTYAQQADLQQLDIVGQVGSRALDGDAGAALGQGFSLADRYIGLRLEFSDTSRHTASRVAIQKSVLAMENINIERRKYAENIKTDLLNIYALLRSSQATLKASKAQVRAEKAKFKAEMRRYREGRSNTATMTQFEGELRAAELRWAMEKVALLQSSYQLALVKGELWTKIGMLGSAL
ncbi:MAG: TolC family protein [Mariprofundaceae bacterium]|nr:TolC family protein [Mariprofundaceae bacterium]